MSSIDYRIIKYPRTPHIEGSRLQPGDEDLSQVPFSAIAGKHLVVEEKIDGANSAISFDPQGNLLLQSRGHYLTGGYCFGCGSICNSSGSNLDGCAAV